MTYLTGGHAKTYANSTHTEAGTANPTLLSNIIATGTDGANFTALNGKIFSYSVNANGEYIIAGTASNVASLNNATQTGSLTGGTTPTNAIKASQARIGNIDGAYANSSTVLAFVSSSNSLNASYTGFAKFPTVAPASVDVVYAKSGSTIVFAVVKTALSTSVADGYGVYLGEGEYTSDGQAHKLLIAGKVESVILAGDGTTDIEVGTPVSYTIDNNDEYTLDESDTATEEEVTVVDEAYIVVDGTVVNLASTYYVYYGVDESYDAADFEEGQEISYVCDSSGNLVVAVITADPVDDEPVVTG